MKKLFVEDLDLKGKKVLIRVDFNVPLDEKGGITDDTRIRGALPTIKYVLRQGGKAILISHLGRPGGERVEKLSLSPVAVRLSRLLGREVKFIDDCLGEKVKTAVSRMGEGEVILLENLRFYPGEKKGDEEFARRLADDYELYIDDAFGTAHRSHASIVGVTGFIPRSAMGYLMEKEVRYLGRALDDPRRPFLAILGGAKVSDKIQVIKSLLRRVDALLIGGAMAYTFLREKGIPVGASRVETVVSDKKGKEMDISRLVREILKQAESGQVPILLPVDHVEAERFSDEAATRVVGKTGIDPGWMGLDIGPETVKLYSARIKDAGTVFWNGPMGVFEMEPFARGTMAIARALADSTAISIIGGGDSVAAIRESGVADRITHISTGGGASLEFLEGETLPGIAALTDVSG